ncbi:MAG TPA: hypothetical protein DEQ43_26505 [Nocardioides bacterium]|nr:hypothetical protein [Nocardioides sp.]
MLPVLSAAAAELASALPPGVVAFREVDDSTLWTDPAPGRLVIALQGHDRSRWRDIAVQNIAPELTGVSTCRNERMGELYQSDRLPDSVAVAQGGAIWLARAAGADGRMISLADESVQVADRLDARPEDQVKSYLSWALPGIVECQGELTGLP